MASIQRQIRRLPVRRRQQLLAAAPRRFSGVEQAGRSYVGEAWLAGIVSVGIFALDWLVAMLLDQSMVIGTLWAIVGGVGFAATVAVARRIVERVKVPATRDPLALKAAVHQEMAVTGDGPTELERIEVRAVRAWGHALGDHEGVLVADCGPDGVACLRGEALDVLAHEDASLPAMITGTRITLEVLRQTRSIISAAARGQRLPVQALPPEVAASLPADTQCEILEPTQLPAPLAQLVGAPVGYR